MYIWKVKDVASFQANLPGFIPPLVLIPGEPGTKAVFTWIHSRPAPFHSQTVSPNFVPDVTQPHSIPRLTHTTSFHSQTVSPNLVPECHPTSFYSLTQPYSRMPLNLIPECHPASFHSQMSHPTSFHNVTQPHSRVPDLHLASLSYSLIP